MASRRIVAKSGWALVCSCMLVLIGSERALANCDLLDSQKNKPEDEIYGNKTLWFELNDQDLPLVEIDRILETILDKEGTRVGQVTVSRLLDYKILDVKYCQADVMHERRVYKVSTDASVCFNFVQGSRRNVGVRRYAQHYLKKLKEFCIEHYDQVLNDAIARMGPTMLEYLEKYAKKEGYLVQLVYGAVPFPQPGSDADKMLLDIELSCRTLNDLLKFTNEQDYMSGLFSSYPPDNLEQILGEWYEKDHICGEYLNCCSVATRQHTAFLAAAILKQGELDAAVNSNTEAPKILDG